MVRKSSEWLSVSSRWRCHVCLYYSSVICVIALISCQWTRSRVGKIWLAVHILCIISMHWGLIIHQVALNTMSFWWFDDLIILNLIMFVILCICFSARTYQWLFCNWVNVLYFEMMALSITCNSCKCQWYSRYWANILRCPLSAVSSANVNCLRQPQGWSTESIYRWELPLCFLITERNTRTV